MSEAIPVQASTDGGGYGLRSRIGLLTGPIVFLVMLASPPPVGMTPEAWRTAAVAILMAVWWITEAVPIPATALVPLALLPVLGVVRVNAAAAPYANPVIFLFMGGFMIAQAMQRWGLHRRIALRIIRLVGSKPRSLVGGFMLAAAFLSMWISNTATAVMMLPIAVSVTEMSLGRGHEAVPPREAQHFATALMLGIAYAASIGGTATLIGTPPNAMMAGFMQEAFGVEVGFARWLLVGIPMVLVMLPVAWWVLTRVAFPVGSYEATGSRALIRDEVARLGPMSRGEALTGTVFVLTALAWIVRPALNRVVPGLSDAGIAVGGGLLLFVLPVSLREGRFALDWPSAARLPWGVLVLFGGGLSLASAISDTGLAQWIGDSMGVMGGLPILLVMLVITLVVIFLTELTSNTATAATFLPIVASFAIGLGENPLFLVVPAVLAASCAFMLPVATPPNAIVYGSGAVTIPQMSRAGLILNLLFAAVIPLIGYGLVILVFGGRIGVLPPWAVP